MTTQLAPTPLMRTNATKNDGLWKRESPISDEDRGFPRPCSPPLKHITPQSTQDLLDSFDPSEFLDSASERSTSSADTMIMMTTEEENRNAQRIKNSLLHYESSKTVVRSPTSPSPSLPVYPYSHKTSAHSPYAGNPGGLGLPLGKDDFAKRRNVPNNLQVSCQAGVAGADKRFLYDKPSPLDDGYGTDSRSNTSASTSSPLSSSFSSLSNFEGSLGSISSAGTPGTPSPNTPTSPNASMSRHAIIKGQPLPPGLRNSGGPRPVLLAAKKRELSPTEVKDNSPNLEDRLRALTTIEEEEFGPSLGGSVHGKYIISDKLLSNKQVSNVSPRSNTQNRVRFDIAVAQDQHNASNDLKFNERESSTSSGFFRAAPVELVTSPFENRDTPAIKDGNISLPRGHHQGSSDVPFAPNSFPSPSHQRKGGWGDYTKYFEKNSDIPIHNITSAGRGKFIKTGTSSDNMLDKDINRKIGTRSVTPSKRPANEHNQNVHHGLSELGRISPDTSVGQTVSGNFRSSDTGRIPLDQPDHPLPPDQLRGHAHSLVSPPDHRPHNGQRSNENRPLTLPVSSYPSIQHLSQAPFYDQSPRSMPSNSNIQSFSQTHNPNPYFYQEPSTFLPQESGIRHQDLPASSPERTSQDEFLSLSRSLSKQNMQLREMLQQEQQPQHQRYHQPHQNRQDQSQTNHQPSPRNEYAPSYPEVVLRNSNLSSSMRSLPGRPDRYSWQASSPSAYPQDWGVDTSLLPDSAPHHRVSLDLGSIPQLQRQIRATSEMCLQMSKKHVFASSADIYKLFQGQRKPDNRQSASATNGAQFGIGSVNSSNNKNGHSQFHRHSFHSTSARPPWASSQPELDHDHSPIDSLKSSLTSLRPSLRVPSPALSISSRVSNPGPVRVDHSITIPPNLRPGLSSSPHLADVVVVDGQKFQRQSSGYSSENELQQIESNARASRKLRTRDPRATVAINPEQEFRPVHSSSDRGSSTTGGDDEGSSTADNEPVYVNQRMLAKAGVLEELETPPLPPKNQPGFPVAVGNPSPRLTVDSDDDVDRQHRRFNNPHQNSRHQQQQQRQQHPAHTQIPPPSGRQFLSPGGNLPTEENLDSSRPTRVAEGLMQKQVINFSNKPVTITSIVPVNSYSPVRDSDQDNANRPSSTIDHDDNHNNHDDDDDYCTLINNHGHNVTPLVSGAARAAGMPRDVTNKITISPGSGESSRPYRPGSSASLQLSPVEVAQMLDVPFATNIISGENGDRLSTLV